MPPKKRKGGKKKNKFKIAIDDIDTTILTRTKLEEYCMNVDLDLNRELQFCESLRLERDKLVGMTAVSTEHLKMLRTKKRKIEEEFRYAEEEHRITMMYNREKITHLRNDLANILLDKTYITNNVTCNERIIFHEMANDITNLDVNRLKGEVEQMEKDFYTNKIQLEKEHAETLYKIREKDKNSQALSETKREKVVKEITVQLKTAFSASYNSLLLWKEKDYQLFLDTNTKRTTELSFYYNKIVNINKDVMQHMKNKLQQEKESFGKLDGLYLELKKKNQNILQELASLNQEKWILKEKLSPSNQNKQKLREIKEKLHKRRQLMQNLKIENHIQYMLNERRVIFLSEMDKISTEKLFNSLSKTQSVIIIMELFVLHIYNTLSEITANLSEIKSMNEKRGKWNILLGSVYEYQDTFLDSINYEITKIAGERKELYRSYRKILKDRDIHFDNTGFKPFRFEELLAKIDNPQILVNENYVLFNLKCLEKLFLS